MKRFCGFTLIEVLLALAVIAIALSALLKATAQNIANVHRLKEKSISHWVAMQGVNMIQLGLLKIKDNEEVTQVTTLLGQKWYWRIKASSTVNAHVQQLTIKVSQNQASDFSNALIAFRYVP